jgi:SAM-dependent methyltransferase
MIPPFIAPAPLYTFLSYCNDSQMPKEILDCGAGGPAPPLTLFHQSGYRTHGVEISQKQLELARQFCDDHNIDLNIQKGDMRDLPFADESMSFIYSYSSICHMSKIDVATAMKEITRVLKKDGLCFVSVCAVPGPGITSSGPKEPGEYPYEEDGIKGIHSIFGDAEPDRLFQAFTLLRKEKRQVEPFGDKPRHGWAELLYFAKKR